MSEEKSTQLSPLKRFNAAITNPKMNDYIKDVIGGRNASSFVTNMVSLVSSNAALQVCEPMTIIYAGLKATALKLSLDSNLGEAYVIPFKDNKTGTSVATFQIGYKGFYQLAVRTGQYVSISNKEVREGEIVGYNYDTDMNIYQRVADRENKPIIGYRAYFKLNNGFEKELYMDVEQIKKHAQKYSQTYRKGFGLWKDDFDGQAKKTVLKLLLNRWGIKSIEMQDALIFDNAIVDKDKAKYIDNENELSDNGQSFAAGMDQVFGFDNNPQQSEEATFEEVKDEQKDEKSVSTSKK